MTTNPLVAALEKAVVTARDMPAPLAVRLQLIAGCVRDLSVPFAEAVDGFVGRLQLNGAGLGAPAVGEVMPEFALPDTDGRLVVLSDLLGAGPVVLSFNRGHWCPYCQLNAHALAEAEATLLAAGARVVAITPERRRYNAALRAGAGAGFPVLSDIDNGYAVSLGLAIWVDSGMAAMIAEAGWDLPRFQGNDAWMLPVPATFVLDGRGIVAARRVDPDYRTRMDIDALLAAVTAVQASPQRAAG